MKTKDRIIIALAVLVFYGCFCLLLFSTERNDEIAQCMSWAIGDDWQSVETRDIPTRWNERHGDLFILHIDDDLTKGNYKIYEAWRKHKLK